MVSVSRRSLRVAALASKVDSISQAQAITTTAAKRLPIHGIEEVTTSRRPKRARLTITVEASAKVDPVPSADTPVVYPVEKKQTTYEGRLGKWDRLINFTVLSRHSTRLCLS